MFCDLLCRLMFDIYVIRTCFNRHENVDLYILFLLRQERCIFRLEKLEEFIIDSSQVGEVKRVFDKIIYIKIHVNSFTKQCHLIINKVRKCV